MLDASAACRFSGRAAFSEAGHLKKDHRRAWNSSPKGLIQVRHFFNPTNPKTLAGGNKNLHTGSLGGGTTHGGNELGATGGSVRIAWSAWTDWAAAWRGESTDDQKPLLAISEELTVSGPETPFRLIITPNAETAGSYDLEWDSQAGKLYNLRTSTDLSGEIAGWTLVEGGIEATPPTNLFTVAPADTMRFYAVEEFDVPPLYSEDFEENDGGFTLVGTPNDWEWGTPNSDNNADLVVTAGNDGSTNSWGTNLGDGGTPSGTIDTAADSVLRSPGIDLTGVTGAELNFAAAIDAETDDIVEVLVKEVGTDTLLATLTPFAPPVAADWANIGPLDLSAGDDKNIYLEFRFQGTSDLFIGLYIDDVVVTEATP